MMDLVQTLPKRRSVYVWASIPDVEYGSSIYEIDMDEACRLQIIEQFEVTLVLQWFWRPVVQLHAAQGSELISNK